jgi:tetratricopeptide (TPR) repeat protein
VNLKFLVGLIAGSIILVGILALVHHLQAGRIATALLWQAQRAEQDERLGQVAKYLGRYLEFQPHDYGERAHLGQVLASEQLATTQKARERALFVLEPVIARDPSRLDLRRQVVRLALALRPARLELALEHLQALQNALPEDGEVAMLFAAYHDADKKDEHSAQKAAAWYRKVTQFSPKQISAYVRLASLLRDPLGQPDQADLVMDELVKSNDQSFQAYLIRARYKLSNDAPDEAVQDVERARQLGPKEVDSFLVAAEAAQKRRRWDEARKHLSEGLALHPNHAGLHQALAQVEILAKQPDKAVACLREALKVVTDAGQTELLWTLANLLIDAARWSEAEEVIAQFTRNGATAAAPRPTAGAWYLQGRVLFGKQDWAQAAALFERTRSQLEAASDSPRELQMQVDLFLGQCYDQLNEPTRQLEAFKRVLVADPKSEAGRLGVAAAYRALGQMQEVFYQYEELTKQPQASASRWIELARLRIEQNVLQGGKNWSGVQEALQKAENALPGCVEVVLLAAQALIVQNRLEEAEKFLAGAVEKAPEQIELVSALADVLERQEKWQNAQALLDKAEKQFNDTVDLRLARVRFWANRRTADAAAVLAKLEKGLEQFSADDQARLLGGLAEASYRLGNAQEAQRLWGLLADQPQQQRNLRLRLLLFELALQSGNEDKMSQALQAIQQIEGSQGTMSRYGEALCLIQLAKNGRKERLDEARVILDQVAVQRPTWPAVLVAKAEIDTLNGNPDQAIANYRNAVKLGDTSPRVIRPLVQLLYQCQRFSEADQEIRQLQRQQGLARDLHQLAADVFLKTRDSARAVQTALDYLAVDSHDYRDYLWVGQVLALSGRDPKEAEQKLRTAVELGATHPETWVALVQFLAAADRKPEAEAVIGQAGAKLPADQAAFALAQCHEALGRLDRAEQYFHVALTAQPKDVLVLRNLAGFLMRRNRPREAEPLLRRILDPKTQAPQRDAAWARRGLAMVLVATGRYPDFLQALKLVGLSLDAAGKVVDDVSPPAEELVEEQRARARVLTTQKTRPFRDKAIALLEDLNQRQTLTGEDQFLLVQLYEAVGDWTKACDLLSTFLTPQLQNPLYVAHYAQALLNEGKLAEADPYIRQLEQWEKDKKLEPGSLGSVDLKVLAMRARGQHDVAIRTLTEHVQRKGARPEEVLQIIDYLARVNRLADALPWCELAWKTCPPELAGGTCLVLLHKTQATDAEYNRVESWLRAAQTRNPQSIPLRLHLADLYDLRGRYAEAEEAYRQVIKQDPLNVVALNNLAWLTVLRSGNGDAALPLISNAIDAFGPRAELLDTRAVVYLAQNQTDKAIADLEQAVNLDTPTGPRYFHMARAHKKAHNTQAAAQAFRKAKELGLKRAALHPVERLAFGAEFDELDEK